MSSAPSPDASPSPSPYAVGFEVVACGQVVPNSKRRIRWRFGFFGPSGARSRKSEHDVTLVWSVYSGKSVLLMDGREMKYDPNALQGTEYSWQLGGRILRVTAQGRSLTNNHWLNPGLRQYDFFVDGVSFFSFPQASALAKTIRAGDASGGSAPVPRRRKSVILAPRTISEEDANLRQAIKESLALEAKRAAGDAPQSPPPERRLSVQASQLLIDFLDDFESTGNTHPPPRPDDPWAFAEFPAPATAPPPVGAGNPFDGLVFDPAPAAQGALVMGQNNQGGNWGLGEQGGQQGPPPYTMTGGYGPGQS